MDLWAEWRAGAPPTGDTTGYKWEITFKDTHTGNVSTRERTYGDYNRWGINVDQSTRYVVTIRARNQHGYSAPLTGYFTTKTSLWLKEDSTNKLRDMHYEMLNDRSQFGKPYLDYAEHYYNYFDKAVQAASVTYFDKDLFDPDITIWSHECCFNWDTGYTDAIHRSSGALAEENELILNSIYERYDDSVNLAITDAISSKQLRLEIMSQELRSARSISKALLNDFKASWQKMETQYTRPLENHLNKTYAPQKHLYYSTRNSLNNVYECLIKVIEEQVNRNWWENIWNLITSLNGLWQEVVEKRPECEKQLEKLADQLLVLAGRLGKDIVNDGITFIENKAKTAVTTAVYKKIDDTAAAALRKGAKHLSSVLKAWEFGVTVGCALTGIAGLLRTGRWSSYSPAFDDGCNTTTAKWLRPLNTVVDHFNLDWTFLPRVD